MEKFNTYSYMLTGAAALAASILVSGCRFGNQLLQSEGPNPISGLRADAISGFYEALPQELSFCANLSSGGMSATNCVSAPTNQIPPDYASVMTNPVILAMRDLASGSALLVGYPNLTSALPVFVQADRSFGFLGSTGTEVLWFHEECTTELSLNQDGRIVPSQVPAGTSSAESSAGRIELSTEVLRTFNGNCAVSLAEMKDCYESSSLCGGWSSSENDNRQTFVRSIFEEYIQAGAIVSSDIPKVTGIAYKVSYR